MVYIFAVLYARITYDQLILWYNEHMVWSGDKSLWDHSKIWNKPEKAVYFTSFGSGTFRPIRTAPNSPFTAVVAWQTITVIVTNICWEKTPKIDQHTKHHNTQNQYWSSSSEEEYIIIKCLDGNLLWRAGKQNTLQQSTIVGLAYLTR